MKRVIALVGISGVGKSHVLREMGARLSFQVVQASALIVDARRAQADVSSQDALRTLGIGDNQALLTAEFARRTQEHEGLVILDGHTVIDTPSGLVQVEPEVFAALGVEAFIFLADEPAAIAARRSADKSRSRPARDEVALATYQDQAMSSAMRSVLRLRVPLILSTPDRADVLYCELTNLGATVR